MLPNMVDVKVNGGVELDKDGYNFIATITFPVKRGRYQVNLYMQRLACRLITCILYVMQCKSYAMLSRGIP